jgi:hypothetical protein
MGISCSNFNIALLSRVSLFGSWWPAEHSKHSVIFILPVIQLQLIKHVLRETSLNITSYYVYERSFLKLKKWWS